MTHVHALYSAAQTNFLTQVALTQPAGPTKRTPSMIPCSVSTQIFSQVVKKTTGKVYAMKIQPKGHLVRSTKSMLDGKPDEFLLHIERSIMSDCYDHPFIISLEYAFCNQTCAMLVMELAPAGTLDEFVKYRGGLPPEVVQQFAVEIALAMQCLHSKGIMYRDLKPANVLLNVDGHIKLCDFGLAGRIKEEVTQNERDESNTFPDEVPISVQPTEVKTSITRLSTGDFTSLDKLTSEFAVPDDTAVPMTPTRNLMRGPNKKETSGTTGETSSTDDKSVNSQKDEPSSEAVDQGGSSQDHESDEDSFNTNPLLIGDFDRELELANIRRIKRRTTCGTAGYRAPEQVIERNLMYKDRNGYTESSDWFSLGATCFALMVGKKPFISKAEMKDMQMRGDHSFEVVSELSKILLPTNTAVDGTNKSMEDYEFKSLMGKVHYPDGFSEDAKDFCEKLLKRTASERMGYFDLRRHPWLADSGNIFDAKKQSLKDPHPYIMEYIAERFPHYALPADEQNFVSEATFPRKMNVTDTFNRMMSSEKLGKRADKKMNPRWHSFPSVLDSICERIHETKASEVAEKLVQRWIRVPTENVHSLYRNWPYISKSAVQAETESAKKAGII